MKLVSIPNLWRWTGGWFLVVLTGCAVPGGDKGEGPRAGVTERLVPRTPEVVSSRVSSRGRDGERTDAVLLRRVGARLSRAVPVNCRGKPVDWRFAVREAPGVNARSWGDGRVEVTAGTLGFVGGESQLAAVVAHEMAHVFHRHNRIQVSESWGALLAGAAVGLLVRETDGDTATASASGFGLMLSVNVGSLMERRRVRELEADLTSLTLLRRAGYPAEAALTFWQRYAAARAAAGHQQGHWWDSHPPDAERVKRLREATQGGSLLP